MNIETKIKLDRFKPRPYQLPLITAIESGKFKRVLAILPRRAGKDVAAFNLMIRMALRKVGVYYYIFPTFTQAKRVIWDSILNSGERFLDFVPSELVASENSSELKLKLINGSLIQLVGSDNFNALMGTNPRGVVFSEYALQDPRAYQFIRPILTANDGWAVFISCVAPDTLVIDKKGLKRIKNISSCRDTYSDLNEPIYGLGGFHNAESFYYGGMQETRIITLESGYELECTPIHPLWNGHEWVKAQDLKVGDLIPVQYGQDVWGDGLDISSFKSSGHGLLKWRLTEDIITPDFFYLLGLIHADGSYNKATVTVTKKKDPEIISFLNSYGFITAPDGIHHSLSSREFCTVLEWLGFRHGARNKEFPDILFTCTKDQIKNFLQGLFDGDGSSNSHPSKRGTVKLTSTCLKFIKDLQVLLLNFGIVSGIRTEEKAPTKKVAVWSTIYNLEISGHFAHIFYETIGFRLARKQKNKCHIPNSVKQESGNIYPIDTEQLRGYPLPMNIIENPSRISRRIVRRLHEKNPHPYLEKLLSEKLFFSPIKSISSGNNDVFDFVIPETNSFFTSGIISHNTPRGKNHLWELFNIATQSPDWFCYKMTVEDTCHIPLREIEREKAEGLMSDDLILQEYYTSFDMGVEGAYYAKYVDKMRLDGRLGDVPWESAFKVHTAWDLGVRDQTCIIFFQTIGQTIRVIDVYEHSKVGLEHYVKVLEQKPYSYGKHIAPHDIKVQEFGSGLTRIEKARQLGIRFTVAPDLSIEDGIESVRSTLSKVWIDRSCLSLIKALENYRQEYDPKKKVYKNHPLHDIYSHMADAFRYLCISLPKTRDGITPEELDKRYYETVYGTNGQLPPFFRDQSNL